MKRLPVYLLGGFCALASLLAQAGDAPNVDAIRAHAMPATEEPLHIVRADEPPFVIYTNDLQPAVWTQYHQHRTDLLAVIAADTRVAGQVPGEEAKAQNAPAGAVVFFPYADSKTPYVHRVGVTGEQPFVNIGVEFHDPLGSQCQGIAPWKGPGIKATTSNRRGSAYHLQLSSGASALLPTQGRGLLLVPLGDSQPENNLQLDSQAWQPALGDFRFYSDFSKQKNPRPTQIKNSGESSVHMTVFVAC